MSKDDKSLVPAIAEFLQLAEVSPSWHRIDAVLPLLERMRADGAVVLVKLDGERVGADAELYTVLVSGPPLHGDFIRADSASLEHALARVIVAYARRCWRFVEPS